MSASQTAPATQTAIVVPVPEAESLVGRFREELDHAAALGVPAHVTVIFPFAPPDRINQDVLTALAESIGSVGAFDAIFDRVSWFFDDVLWLAPEPAESFRRLTAAVWDRFPEYPPYGGEYAEVTPHLTVGHNQPIETLRAVARTIEPRLPVRTRVQEAWLLQGSDEAKSWRTITKLPLGHKST